jgi:heme-degrading monooxygenase HmoA
VVVSVFARVSQYSVPPERQDQAHRAAEEHIGPALKMQLGFCGDLLLSDRKNGRMLTVTLWESEEDMHATDEASNWFRSFGVQQAGGRVETVEFYEVMRAPQNLGAISNKGPM